VKRAAASLAVAAWVLTPSLARACPMCFDGGNSNSQAFVWGSLLLMFVPTVALGTLGYLAYRRIKAVDSQYEPRVGADETRVSGEPPTLRP
jgi:hypothetical protein